MILTAAFWIVVYCGHPDRCYVSQDVVGQPNQYATKHACLSEIPGAIADVDPAKPHPSHEIKHNSRCISVNAVSCFKGGSVCQFDAADDAAKAIAPSMVQPPAQ